MSHTAQVRLDLKYSSINKHIIFSRLYTYQNPFAPLIAHARLVAAYCTTLEPTIELNYSKINLRTFVNKHQ